MCGIFGFSNIDENVDELLRKMALQQIHRGPDDEGFYINGNLGFGLRRLSVIDIQTGHQPICNEDKSIWVVCNGEIYNYLELTNDLKKKGHYFYTRSDIECIAHLYEEYGIDFLKHLNGMFGIALYDVKNKILILARDRLGIKPLYYSKHANTLLFASELRSILASGIIPKALDWTAISLFLDLMYIPTPYTPFQEIFKMKAGHFFKVENGYVSEERPYWELGNSFPESAPRSENEAIEVLTSVLKDSVRLQLRSDVPLCSFLSGGVDSGAVTAFAAMESSHRLDTYHVYFENSENKIDEREFAKAVAKRYGTNHTEININKDDFLRLVPKILWHLEEPFGDLASIPTYIISEMAKKDVTVCLNGSGGDELFAGYPHHRPPTFAQNLYTFIDKTIIGDSLRTVLGRTKFSASCRKLFPEYREIDSVQNQLDSGKKFSGDPINKILARDIDGYLQSNVLFLLDKVAMSVSLEGRVPLLDHRFVELSAHLPSELKMKNGERKYIFKKMLEPFLPHEVIYRKKEGFGAPLSSWMDTKVHSMLKHIVENGSLRKNGLINFKHAHLGELRDWHLWQVACLEIWFRVIFESFETCPNYSLSELH